MHISNRLVRRGGPVAILAGLCLAGAGAAQATAAPSAPGHPGAVRPATAQFVMTRPAAWPGGPQLLRLGPGDDGRTVHVRPGARIEVDLTAANRRPSSTDPNVLVVDRRFGGYPTGAPAAAGFRALRSGTARIVSAYESPCAHTRPMRCLVRKPFQVDVLVDASDRVRPRGDTRVLSEQAAGRTVTVGLGQDVTVLLHSTYWTITDPAGAALVPGGSQVTERGAGCAPGMGCGTVRRDFHAVRLGTATLIATRSSCGEAMRCTGDQGRFTVTVRVVPADDPDGFGKRAYPGDDRGRLRDSHGHRFHSDAGRGRHHHHRWSRRHHEWQ